MSGVPHLTRGRAGLCTQFSSSEGAFSIMSPRRSWAESLFQVLLSHSILACDTPTSPRGTCHPPVQDTGRQMGLPSSGCTSSAPAGGWVGTCDHPVSQVMRSESSWHLAGPGESSLAAVKIDCGIRLPGPSTLLSRLEPTGPWPVT